MRFCIITFKILTIQVYWCPAFGLIINSKKEVKFSFSVWFIILSYLWQGFTQNDLKNFKCIGLIRYRLWGYNAGSVIPYIIMLIVICTILDKKMKKVRLRCCLNYCGTKYYSSQKTAFFFKKCQEYTFLLFLLILEINTKNVDIVDQI